MPRQVFAGQYILNAAGEPEPCYDAVKWSRWFERAHRDLTVRVGYDEVGSAWVSPPCF